jgi:hypothetical protein
VKSKGRKKEARPCVVLDVARDYILLSNVSEVLTGG